MFVATPDPEAATSESAIGVDRPTESSSHSRSRKTSRLAAATRASWTARSIPGHDHSPWSHLATSDLLAARGPLTRSSARECMGSSSAEVRVGLRPQRG
ncbi:hypothetical protein PsYK624_130480 [Phanerochaete sordida]|uniref:Uncharacterized protein n=1 Tax=Phanerochaete sordida TaxID=48140 RepID=A0A9P3GLA5_9APHY|nr:hypothetical protein PsYK624_130480 [Phanerochaete sordida]